MPDKIPGTQAEKMAACDLLQLGSSGLLASPIFQIQDIPELSSQ
jgi:hypothetical protein